MENLKIRMSQLVINSGIFKQKQTTSKCKVKDLETQNAIGLGTNNNK